MTHTHSIINLACIIRKHESGNVIKVLLVAPLSSLWPHALFVLAARCWSFTDRALICVAARLLTSRLYVQSGFLMKRFGRQEVNELNPSREGSGVELDSDVFSRTIWAILWFAELRQVTRGLIESARAQASRLHLQTTLHSFHRAPTGLNANTKALLTPARQLVHLSYPLTTWGERVGKRIRLAESLWFGQSAFKSKVSGSK